MDLDTIIHGDALEVLRSLPDACVDAVVTDPPYSSGTRREAAKGLRRSMRRGMDDAQWFGSDSLTTDGFWWLIHGCAVQWHRVVKPGGHVLAFIDWRMMPSMAGAIEAADLRHLKGRSSHPDGIVLWPAWLWPDEVRDDRVYFRLTSTWWQHPGFWWMALKVLPKVLGGRRRVA